MPLRLSHGDAVKAKEIIEKSVELDFSTSKAFTSSLEAATGIQISIADTRVCEDHDSPWEMFKTIHLERPIIALVLGARGTGKSFLSALDTHLTSLAHPSHETRILGGSRSQSEQIYRALRYFTQQWEGSDLDRPTRTVLASRAQYRNGSEVSILAASPTSVRGPHVPSLKLDEVDEIDRELLESATGMCMELNGLKPSILMTSTWHRISGNMSYLIERAQAKEFPLFKFCIFEVLETCPEERSGVNLENCPTCPLLKYCHDVPAGIKPKAKRSKGHYSIDSLIQKLRMTGGRIFEADYLCNGPKPEGVWFSNFTRGTHVTERAEFDPHHTVHVAIDSGVFTGAVFFHVIRDGTVSGTNDTIHVFADYLSEGTTAEMTGRAIISLAEKFCDGRLDRVSTDPAGGSRNPMGVTVIAEYERVGLRGLERWPVGPVADGLALLESFANPADGAPRLLIHPRCKATISAMASYRRAKRGGQWQDYPEDPQHPHEDLIDSLRGGIRTCYPEGRIPQRSFTRIQARQVF